MPIEFLSPNPRNPRRNFAEAELADLAQSIREHGIVQPVVVRPSGEAGRYEIIAGERRWRAAQRAGLTEIPVIVRDVNDRVALELAIIENVQRADLNPVEEALGYQQLIDEHSYTQADLGQIIGKSRSHVANTLRLLKLPDPVRDMLVDGSLSAGHARTLVTADDPAGLARRIVEGGLSVRQAEALAQQPPQNDNGPRPAPKRADKDADTLALEKTAVGRVRPEGGDQPQGKGRRGADRLPHARAARRALPAAAARLNADLFAAGSFRRLISACSSLCRWPAWRSRPRAQTAPA